MINDANSHAGEQVVITYQVKVTSENDTITNKAQPDIKMVMSMEAKKVKLMKVTSH